MDYNDFMNQKIDIKDVLRMSETGDVSVQMVGPKISVREFLAGLDLAYKQRDRLNEVIESMEAHRKSVIL